MLRRILAALALITGLAIADAPADARVLTGLSQQVEGAAQNQLTAAPSNCPVTAPRANLAGKADPLSACRSRKPVIIYLPTVQFGPDRAFE